MLRALPSTTSRLAERLECWSYHLNTGVCADDNGWVERPEQTGDDDAGNGPHGLIEAARIEHTLCLERHIENVIAVVGHQGTAGEVEAPDGRAADLSEQPNTRSDGERQHLYGDGTRRAKAVDSLCGVDDDHETPTGRGQHLFAEERGASALDDVPRRINLVGTVNREIERRVRVEVRERNAEVRGVCGGGDRGGDPNDAQSGVDAGREDIHDRHRGAPGAVPNHHPVVDDLSGDGGGGKSLVERRVGSHRGPVCHPTAVPCPLDRIAAGTIMSAMGEPDADGGANVLAAFAVGLQPILAHADVDAFRQYLGRWDEVLGDTSALAMQSDAEVRRTMAEMLRRPRQFGLPAWAERAGPATDTAAADAPLLADPPLVPDAPLSLKSSPVLDTIAVEPIDVPQTVYDELTSLGDPFDDGPARGTVCEAPGAWRQSDFVTGTLVEPRGRIPRVMPVVRTEPSPRSAPRVPRGFRQLDLPFGQGE